MVLPSSSVLATDCVTDSKLSDSVFIHVLMFLQMNRVYAGGGSNYRLGVVAGNAIIYGLVERMR